MANSRKSLARVIRAYAAGEIEANQAKCYGYLLGQLLGFLRAEQDSEVLWRIERLEDLLSDPQRLATAQLQAQHRRLLTEGGNDDAKI